MKKTYILFLTVIIFLAACQKEENSRSDSFGEGSGAFRLEQPSVQSEKEIPVIVTKGSLVWNLPHFRFGSISRVQMVHIRNIRVLFLIRL